MEQILEFLDQIDKDMLLYLHSIHSDFLDIFMANVTKKYNWIPLYIILLVSLFRQFGWQAIYSIIAVILLVTISDQLTSSFMINEQANLWTIPALPRPGNWAFNQDHYQVRWRVRFRFFARI